ncbi:hypothetical protein Lesp02_55970 [Lentzea sp. NBRC 105346]|uniref:SRPBCC family protein n=1 Tax=Lentzea sp. NBRC 105346 TaxID=3032205 RepID=UPI0024A0CD12|nr:SRPBCC family protein [Lentzea sp. NBRC 105346]GLZ33409.1 hypothetical protein Lesp02_55970 [Lentzea sp. NBRC 105346]
MIEIVRQAHVDAPVDAVWARVSDAARTPSWFAFAERVEVRSGSGLGELRTQHGRWGGKAAEVDQEVIAFEPGRLLRWRHVEERLNGRPAPKFAASTEFSIELEADGGGTIVRLRSRQEPASRFKGWLMKAGSRDVAKALERSLARLSVAED